MREQSSPCPDQLGVIVGVQLYLEHVASLKQMMTFRIYPFYVQGDASSETSQ